MLKNIKSLIIRMKLIIKNIVDQPIFQSPYSHVEKYIISLSGFCLCGDWKVAVPRLHKLSL